LRYSKDVLLVSWVRHQAPRLRRAHISRNVTRWLQAEHICFRLFRLVQSWLRFHIPLIEPDVRIARGGLDPGCFRGVPAMEGSGQKRNSVFADRRISALRYYKEAGITCRSLNRRATTLRSRRCAPNVAGGSKLRRALYGAKGGPRVPQSRPCAGKCEGRS
jgi:hypothetical protein